MKKTLHATSIRRRLLAYLSGGLSGVFRALGGVALELKPGRLKPFQTALL